VALAPLWGCGSDRERHDLHKHNLKRPAAAPACREPLPERTFPFLEVIFRLKPFISSHLQQSGRSRMRFRKRECFSEDFPMKPKTIAKLLILSAFATAGANSASAPGEGFKIGVFGGGDRDGGGFHGRLVVGSWAAATDTATTMDMATGTESLPVTTSAISSASV
jgi:hypothetical protein